MAKAILPFLILVLSLLSTIQVTRGQFGNPTPYLQVTLDKAYYYPGDSGTVSVDIKDTLLVNIVIYNMSITFPWRAYINGRWDGNQTISFNGALGQAIASGAWLPTVRIGFIEPTDSRYYTSPFFFGGSGGQLNVWASGVGPNGGPGPFGTSFPIISAYFAYSLEIRTQTYILIALTILIGVMTGAVLYYVRASLKLKRSSFTAPPTSSPSTPQT